MNVFYSYKIYYLELTILTVQESQAIFGAVVNFLNFWRVF